MRKLLIIIFLGILACLIYGFVIKSPLDNSGDFFIGIGVVGIFFLWMPLFIYHRYKGKDIKKYMLDDDFFKQIKDEADTFLD